MAFLFADSFDHYVTADLTTKWTTTANSPSISAANGRRSSAAFRQTGASSSNQSATVTLSPGDTKAIIGAGFRALALSARPILATLDAGSVQVTLRMDSDGKLSAWRGDLTTLLGTTASVALTANVYAYVELKVVHHQTTGTVDVQVNGANVLSLTGQDTCATVNQSWSQFRIGGNASSPSTVTHDFDDVYACDGIGSLNNNFLGDVRVDAHVPNANGNSSMSTPSTGADRYATVDEAAPNSDTDYNTLAATNDKDTLGLANLAAAGSSILAYQTVLYEKKTDAGVGSVAPVIRHSGTDYDGTGVACGTAYNYTRQPYETNPGTGAQMTESDFNALEVGYKRTA